MNEKTSPKYNQFGCRDLVQGVTHLLMFNPDDFRRINEILVVHPQAIANLEAEG